MTRYAYVLRTRSDVYIAQPFPLLTAMGVGEGFDAAWRVFRRLLNSTDVGVALRAWFMTAGMPFYYNITVRRTPPAMVWSPCNAYDFNKPLLEAISARAATVPSLDAVRDVQRAIHDIAHTMHVMFSNGGLFVHFGTLQDMLSGAHALVGHYPRRSTVTSTPCSHPWDDGRAPGAAPHVGQRAGPAVRVLQAARVARSHCAAHSPLPQRPPRGSGPLC